MAAELTHGAIAQHIGPAAPAQRRGDIGERQRRHAEAALVGIIADAEIEFPDTISCNAAMVRSMISRPGEQFDHFSPALLIRTIT